MLFRSNRFVGSGCGKVFLRALIFSILFWQMAFSRLGIAASPTDGGASQVDFLRAAESVQLDGANRSLEDSTGKAMLAVLALGDGKLMQAVSNGYKSYVAFKGAENMDRARKQEILTRAALASVGSSNLREDEIKFLVSHTSYSRLDGKFLEQGDAAGIAKEFEKKTGISRGAFLKKLAALSDNKIYVSDPDLLKKIDQEYRSFLEMIPNREFKEKLASETALIPEVQRNHILGTAARKMADLTASLLKGSSSLDASAIRAPANSEKAKEGKEVKLDSKGTEAENSNLAFEEE